ncbi:HEAT repeat domain-containing protein [Streptomyces sp. SP17BM10]|uniref:HEAT repeat domain-containing protein n=1 Tax=Streptomyces sp. SP17BM10 TaxID=3002530 RepID=UPI002E772109|nr:HEAT repeat domain-containing protein [Streptomyces sp. SP17BM10]MEE1782836.1 HEAT repeat domain-containing protein [Streptomyces sp. SP17BM10]
MRDLSADDQTVLLDELAAGLLDPDGDLDELAAIETHLTGTLRADLVPRLEAHLETAVAARNRYARSVLADLLAETAGRSSLPVLLRAWSRDLGDDQDGLTTMITVLAQDDPAAARRTLLPWTDSPDADLRRAALWLLGFVPDPADVAVLGRAAHDRDERIRSVVAGTLGSHGTDPAAVDLMVALLRDPSERVRISALGSLGYRRQPRTLPDICRLADDDSPHVRAWVAIALRRFPATEIGDEPVADVLARLERDSEPHVRDQALAARHGAARRGR